jgi:hypothetical protein
MPWLVQRIVARNAVAAAAEVEVAAAAAAGDVGGAIAPEPLGWLPQPSARSRPAETEAETEAEKTRIRGVSTPER